MSQVKIGTLCKAQTWNIIPNSRVETKTENLMATHKSLLNCIPSALWYDLFLLWLGISALEF